MTERDPVIVEGHLPVPGDPGPAWAGRVVGWQQALEELFDHPDARDHAEQTPSGGGHSWRCIPIAEAVESVGKAIEAEAAGSAVPLDAKIEQTKRIRDAFMGAPTFAGFGEWIEEEIRILEASARLASADEVAS